MNVIIKESVRQAGLEEAVRKVSGLFPKVIAKALQHLVRVTWEVLGDASGEKWVLVTLEYDDRVKEREVFERGALGDEDYMRERFEWLWGRVLRSSLMQRADEPLTEGEESVVNITNG